ncbi:hypothetical protein GCM10009839_13530 [Catenulispora yoronensis]|uniref:Tat pathway signal protein n=1 Tax=Catenulispora yoronensis TaxID=450799 RepID=A0ABN2TRR7_9ACTN
MGMRRSRAAAVVAAGVMAAGVVAAGAGTASAAAGPTGRVCIFDAPDGAYGLGHVAWAYRWSDGSGSWDYGATESSHNWRKSGTEKQMLHDFATLDESGGYRSYRCKDTAADDQAAATATATAGFARSYDLATDNCLTRSIEIFKAYDGSGGLNGLDDGRYTFPNAYFNYALPGWGPETKL